VTFVVHAGDCRAVLRTLAPASIDAVVTDPPYGDTSLAWDDPVDGWLPLVLPLLKPSASLWCFGSMRFFMDHGATFAGWQMAQEIVWEKHNGSSFHNDRFRRVHELAVHFYPKGRRWSEVFKNPQTRGDGVERVVRRSRGPDHCSARGAGTFVSAAGGKRMERSVIRVQSCHGKALHPTQKPEGIVLPLIAYSCPRGGGSPRSVRRERDDRRRRHSARAPLHRDRA
jgi:site-specific DNA-methyltransferase (adenine-specific)